MKKLIVFTLRRMFDVFLARKLHIVPNQASRSGLKYEKKERIELLT